MKEITLTLTVEETNQILDALGNQPFKEVFHLIGNIQNQAAGQLDGSPPAPSAPAPPKPERINPEASVAAEPDGPKK